MRCLRRSRGAAAIGLRSVVAVIAASILSFAQAPTEKAQGVLMSSDPPDAVFPATFEPTANADVQPPHQPTDDPVNDGLKAFLRRRPSRFAFATVKKSLVGTTVSGP